MSVGTCAEQSPRSAHHFKTGSFSRLYSSTSACARLARRRCAGGDRSSHISTCVVDWGSFCRLSFSLREAGCAHLAHRLYRFHASCELGFRAPRRAPINSWRNVTARKMPKSSGKTNRGPPRRHPPPPPTHHQHHHPGMRPSSKYAWVQDSLLRCAQRHNKTGRRRHPRRHGPSAARSVCRDASGHRADASERRFTW